MQKIFKNRYFVISFSIIVVIALMGGSFYFGYQEGTKKPQTVIVRGVGNLEEGKIDVVDFSLFWEAWQLIKDKYVESEKLNNQNLVYGAVSGLLETLKDPNSVFFPPDDAKKFSEDISGEFSGIGAEIGMRNEQLVIVAPLKDTPAERAGLQALDKILKVDETSTANLSVDEAVKLIRGKKGMPVTLTIIRNGWENSKDITIVRDRIEIPSLDWEMLENDIAYIQLYNFYENTPFAFYRMILEMVFKNPRGIVLDLRDNPGGYLDVAVNLASWLLKGGEVVVSEEFSSDEKNVFKSSGTGAGLFKNVPLIVLINEGSASASEILAGALRDNRGVKLVGKTSFGKGTVQELTPLKDGSMVKITVAHWRLPGGQLIEGNGLTPDYEVDLTDEDIEAGRDPQLDKAINILKSEISK